MFARLSTGAAAASSARPPLGGVPELEPSVTSPPQAIDTGLGCGVGAATATAETGDSPALEEASDAATSRSTATPVRVVPMRRIPPRPFAADAGDPAYQAWLVPQCGQPT